MFMEVLPLGLSIQWPIHSHWGAGESGFSSSVGSQFSVVSLLTSPRRNIGNDHLATAIASSQRNSIHPQAMLVVEPQNLHPME